MSTETEVISNNLPVVRERSAVTLMPVMDIQTALSRLHQFQEFISSYLQESGDGGNDGGDYGIIPGTKKKTLLKSGADKLCEVYGLYDEYEVISSVEDWDKGLFDYTLKCILKSRRDDSVVGTGVGSCSSYESKYRWRDSQRKCPNCNVAAIIKGKQEYGGGWVCFDKKGGCKSKFKDGDKSIEGQVIGRVDNPDIIDTKNTVLKMAKKRAKIDATIGATRSSGIFSQDMEDFPPAVAMKPPAPTTTEDIEIGGPAHSGGSESPKQGASGTQEPKAPETTSEGGEYIDAGKQANFHKECRAAVRPAKSMDADNLTYQWLLDNKYVDDDGKPTAARIPAGYWPQAKKQACAWLKVQ